MHKAALACLLIALAFAFAAFRVFSPHALPKPAAPSRNVNPGATAKPGPFGFECGMTKEQVIALVGKDAAKATGQDVLELSTAPRPHPAFDSYMLIFSPEKGLLKIQAYGAPIATNGFGEEVHRAFIEIRDAVSKTYGEPKTIDYLRSGSIWKEPEDWMMGLLKKERVLLSVWDMGSAGPNHIEMVTLEADGRSTEKAWLSLGYHFEGFPAYVDSKKAKAATAF